MYSLGISLLNGLEKIHNAGYVYNDLKLDNLMLDQGVNIKEMISRDDDIFENVAINFVDFGCATPFLESDGQTHVQKIELEFFKGNKLFSRLNQ